MHLRIDKSYGHAHRRQQHDRERLQRRMRFKGIHIHRQHDENVHADRRHHHRAHAQQHRDQKIHIHQRNEFLSQDARQRHLLFLESGIFGNPRRFFAQPPRLEHPFDDFGRGISHGLLQIFDLLHHIRQMHRLAHVPFETVDDMPAEFSLQFYEAIPRAGICGSVAKPLCHFPDQRFSGLLLGVVVPDRLEHVLVLIGSSFELIHRVLNFYLNADPHVEFDWSLVINSSEHTFQATEAIDASEEHLVRRAESTAAGIPERMPRQLFHAAEFIAQGKPVEARKDLSAFEPGKNQLEQNAEQGSYHQGEQDRVDPIVGPSFNSLYRMREDDTGHQKQADNDENNDNGQLEDKWMGGVSQFRRFVIVDAIPTAEGVIALGEARATLVYKRDAAQALPHPPIARGGEKKDWQYRRYARGEMEETRGPKRQVQEVSLRDPLACPRI